MTIPRVCVVGAGVGGLAAAAALAPYAGTVRVVDRDGRPERPEARRRIPQGAHISILLEAGVRNLEQLLPGFRKDLLAAGSVSIRAGIGQQIHAHGQWFAERDLGFDFLGQSRPQLEHVLARRVLALPNVVLSTTSVVREIRVHDGVVRGVVVEDASGRATAVDCDLVIDASGAHGRMIPGELAAALRVDERRIDIVYSTVHFAKPEAYRGTKENILLVPDPGGGGPGASLIDVEHERWCVSLHGRGEAIGPRNHAQWMALAETLPDARISERLSEATPLGRPATFRKPRAVWRRFELCDRVPLGYLPVGDTIASLNPVFGQGMTLAFGHAAALGRCLSPLGTASERGWRQQLRDEYLPKAAGWSGRAWRSTAAQDLAHLAEGESEAKRFAALDMLGRARQRQAAVDRAAHLRIVLASQMLDETDAVANSEESRV